jgi:predicted GNAT family N-acyltransferase
VSNAESNWVMERLGRQHDRSQFDCGYPSLNDWLKLRAGQFEKKHLARTCVCVRKSESLVLGYYALSSHRVRYEALFEDQAKGLPKIDVPVVLLGRLAVDQSVRGQGLGQLLLVDALRKVQHISELIGVRAVEVDAIDDKASNFYMRFGFLRLADAPLHLFLAIHDIHQLGLPPLDA